MRQASWSNGVAPHMSLPAERRRREGERRDRLRRRRLLAGDAAARGDRDFVDRQDRLAGAPVEHVDIALLGRLHQRRHLRAADRRCPPASAAPACRGPRGRGARPGTTSAACRSRDRARPPSWRSARRPGCGPIPSWSGDRLPSGKYDQAERLVDARRRPCRSACSACTSRPARAAPSDRACRDPSSTPDGRRSTSKARITPDGLFDRRVVVDRAADDDQLLRHHRRRGLHVVAGLQVVHVRRPAVDHAVLAEAGARLAGRRVQLEQSRVDARQDDAPRARAGVRARRGCTALRRRPPMPAPLR